MTRKICRLAFAPVMLAVPGVLPGQNWVLNPFHALGADRAGIRLHGVSVFSSYYSSGTPFGMNMPFAGPMEPNMYAGVSASMGWGRSGETSSVGVSYSPSYVRTVRNADFSSVNHSLSLAWERQIAAKWSFGASAGGVISNLEQLMFTPTQLGQAAVVPATFDDLAAAMLAGRSGNFPLAAALTGASPLSSAERTFPYGNRVLSAALQMTLSYAWSPRTSLGFAVHGTRAQSFRHAGGSEPAAATYLLPQTTTAGAQVALSHSLTPRTHIGATVSADRTFSRIQQAYITRAYVSIGRTMSRRWLVQGRFGAGYLTYARQVYVGSRGSDYVAGGAIGVKAAAHTFLASCDRTIGDSYGIGAGSTVALAGTWNWRRPRSGWAAHSTIGYQRMDGSALNLVESWSATAGVARSLGAHLFVSAQYGYFRRPGHAVVWRGDRNQQGVTVSLTWSPSGNR